MNARTLWSRILKVGGGIAMVLGTLDPLEGSLLILSCGTSDRPFRCALRSPKPRGGSPSRLTANPQLNIRKAEIAEVEMFWATKPPGFVLNSMDAVVSITADC